MPVTHGVLDYSPLVISDETKALINEGFFVLWFITRVSRLPPFLTLAGVQNSANGGFVGVYSKTNFDQSTLSNSDSWAFTKASLSPNSPITAARGNLVLASDKND
jgi:hypothetical protein